MSSSGAFDFCAISLTVAVPWAGMMSQTPSSIRAWVADTEKVCSMLGRSDHCCVGNLGIMTYTNNLIGQRLYRFLQSPDSLLCLQDEVGDLGLATHWIWGCRDVSRKVAELVRESRYLLWGGVHDEGKMLVEMLSLEVKG